MILTNDASARLSILQRFCKITIFIEDMVSKLNLKNKQMQVLTKDYLRLTLDDIARFLLT